MRDSMRFGPCAKQRVYCVILDPVAGNVWKGSNFCYNAQKECPRKDMPTGEGYELCKSVCDQAGHAEWVTASRVIYHLVGGIAFLMGHTYACESCKQILRDVGVTTLFIGKQNEKTREYTWTQASLE